MLGGGITGLATAYYLTQEKPHAKVTLYEGSDRLGGWLNSTAVDVGDGSVVFEQGPRTLRPSIPAGLVTMHMVISSNPPAHQELWFNHLIGQEIRPRRPINCDE